MTSEALFAELVMISYKCNAGKKKSQARMQHTKGKSSILGGQTGLPQPRIVSNSDRHRKFEVEKLYKKSHTVNQIG